MKIRRKMKEGRIYSCIIYLSLATLLLFSCQNTKGCNGPQNSIVNNNIHINEGAASDYLTFNYYNEQDNYELIFKKNDSSRYWAKYIFDEGGNLNVKSVTNFWGEIQRYFFDVNGTLVGYRKLIELKEGKYNVQDFIVYKNGRIDVKKSHHFDYNILDSTEIKYKIRLDYHGAVEIDSIYVYGNEFPIWSEDLKFKYLIAKGHGRVFDFWVDKSSIYNREFEFLQLNVKSKFLNSEKAFTWNTGDNLFPSNQVLILRKFMKELM